MTRNGQNGRSSLLETTLGDTILLPRGEFPSVVLNRV